MNRKAALALFGVLLAVFSWCPGANANSVDPQQWQLIMKTDTSELYYDKLNVQFAFGNSLITAKILDIYLPARGFDGAYTMRVKRGEGHYSVFRTEPKYLFTTPKAVSFDTWEKVRPGTWLEDACIKMFNDAEKNSVYQK